MAKTSSDREPIDRLAEEFLARFRRGERPAVAEYADRHPDLADEIRELFPALVMMEQAAPGSADPSAVAVSSNGRPAAPERLGDFRILREVGRGGMGVVYEALQESLGRHVALKLLPPEAILDPKRLRRFQREAKAAANLHHTNIVPVYGVGEHGGTHFYAMQFIRGQGMDSVIDELRRLRAGGEVPARGAARSLMTGEFVGGRSALADFADATGPDSDTREVAAAAPTSTAVSGSLGDTGRHYWESVARLGAQVADALAYAHAQGIIHRDVKPSNLLLDPAGTVWVTDFGLAKVTSEADDLSHAGDILGTLRYMAPERFGGEGDTRADTYALGLTLYELLTFRPAFDGESRPKLIESVLHDDPARPRTLHDLGHALQRAGRFADGADAHRRAVAAWRQWSPELKVGGPVKAKSFARSALSLANHKLACAYERAGQFEDGVEAARQLFAIGAEVVADEPNEEFAIESRNDARNDLIRLLMRAGKGDEAAALAQREWAEPAPANQSDEKRRSETVHAILRRGDRLGRVNRFAEADETYQTAVATCRQLMSDFPGAAIFRGQLTIALRGRGDLLDRTGQAAAADAAYREGLAEVDPLVEALPAAPPSRRWVAVAIKTLAHAFAARGWEDEARHCATKALDVLTKMAEHDSASLDVANELAWLLATSPVPDLRDPARAVALARKTIEPIPAGLPRNLTEAKYSNTLGVAHYRAGEWPAAIDRLWKSVDIQGPNPTDGYFLAMAYWQQGDRDAALQHLAEAVRYHEIATEHIAQLRSFRTEAEALIGRADGR